MGEAIMFRWWMGVALLTAGLLPGTAWSQQGGVMPTPIGAARIPDPTAIYRGPELVPGPLTPQIAPAGPPDNLSLPNGHSSAFQEENYPAESAWWFNIGTQFLARYGYGRLPVFYRDPLTNLDTGDVPNRLNPLYFLLDGNHLDRMILPGVRGSVGYLFDNNYSLELAGWYNAEQTATQMAFDQGRLNSFFVNAPTGFQGNNGLWLQADIAQLLRKTSMANAEMNYRYTGQMTEPELIVGLRYFDMVDQFGIYSGDDDVTFTSTDGSIDTRRTASLSYITKNRIVAPQIGFEWTPVNASIFTMGFNGKAALGANFVEFRNRLVRGDGFQGFDTRTEKVAFGQIYEIGAFIDLSLLERMRVRTGYQCMWIAGIADAQDQVSFDLRNTRGRLDVTGSQFWHGPTFEFQFLF